MLKPLQLLLALFSLIFFTNAFAVDETYVHSQAQSFLQDLEAKTTLSADQKTQMNSILTDSITQREAAIAKYKGQSGIGVKRNIRNDLEAINASTQAEVKKVLNEEQYQAFLQVQDARKEQIRARIDKEF